MVAHNEQIFQPPNIVELNIEQELEIIRKFNQPLLTPAEQQEVALIQAQFAPDSAAEKEEE